MFPEGKMMELLMIGAIALIGVGPKDLPILMRKVGQFVGKMRGMAAEFRASFDELARQSELEELRREVEAMRVGQQTALSQLNPLADTQVRSVFEDIHHDVSKPLMQPLAAPAPEPALAPEPAPVIDAEAAAPPKPKTPRASRAKAAGEKAAGAKATKSAGARAAKATRAESDAS